jgi:hypothetical protein
MHTWTHSTARLIPVSNSIQEIQRKSETLNNTGTVYSLQPTHRRPIIYPLALVAFGNNNKQHHHPPSFLHYSLALHGVSGVLGKVQGQRRDYYQIRPDMLLFTIYLLLFSTGVLVRSCIIS